MKSGSRARNASGFSLVETLSVVAFSLLLGTLAVPQVVRTMQRQRLNTASRNLATTLQAARFVAILRQGTFGVQINNTTHSYEVVQWNGTSWQNLNGGSNYDTYSNKKLFGSSVSISTAGLGSAHVVAFNSRGELLDASASPPVPYTSGSTVPSITLTTATGSQDVILTRFGNIRIVLHSSGTQL